MVTAAYLRSSGCPVCGTSNFTSVISSSPPAEAADYSLIRSSWLGFFKRKIFFTYQRCLKCGILFTPIYLSDSALSDLYGAMPDNTAGLDKRYLEATQHGYFEFLSKHSSLSGDYFELGPDVGLFTKFVAAEQAVRKLWLYEPNRSVAQGLSLQTNGKPFEIRTEMNDFSAIPDGTLSTCVLIHVLDHLPDVRHVVMALRRKMSPEGRLLIVTHNEHSWPARFFRHRWPAYCLQHPLLFNKTSTSSFLASVGFEVIETRNSVNVFPLTYLIKHFLYAMGITSISDWNWSAFPIALRLGNIMTVAKPT
jgi:hypothetical protein